jgi:hypothetical protein
MHLVDLEPATSPSTLLLQSEEIAFELKLLGHEVSPPYQSKLLFIKQKPLQHKKEEEYKEQKNL